MMEQQISRIESNDDLRSVNVQTAQQSAEAHKDVIKTLRLTLGDTYEIERPKYVKPDADAGKRLKAVMGGAC